ncbi:hypothetical protein BDZ94DRAFT_1152120 [Collybia nuda]|uniref:Uncharacterized protein n=1 Tax=Collybia nuda TaxID=64659 RepID=A0A9P6CK72_9AGAR|nr:hypothetical protein BDZ94DRAFT_1152120 [Collybia nuda]
MSVSIHIVPISDSLDMCGEPDSSSAYSLSGHVSISLTSPYSLFERRRTARLLLQSVLLTFEGQTEIITPQSGYAPLRLCSVTREIAPSDSIELNNEGHEESAEPCKTRVGVWNVVFNLPIPGWLPATTTYGVEEVGIRYGLFAEAKFINLDDNQTSTWSFATLCAPFRSKVKSVHAQTLITLRRLMSLPGELTDASSPNTMTYLVNSPVSAAPSQGRPQIPLEVISKIQVLASVPDYVDVDGDHFPLIIRMRTKDLDASECKRIRLSSIAANVIQKEKTRSRPSSEYLIRYPVPSSSQQPPNVPLRDAHPISSVYDVGLYVYSNAEGFTSRSFSLLPPGESGFHPLGEDNYPFAEDGDADVPPTWYTLETNVPYMQRAPSDKTADWAGPSIIRPTVVSPLISIRHEVTIELTCTYHLPNSDEQASERLSFSVPIRVAKIAPTHSQDCFTPPPSQFPASMPIGATLAPSLPELVPYAQSLPAYSQLFDRNGDRKIDYSTPLPLYSPRSPISTSSALREFDAERKDLLEPLLQTNLLA